MELKNVWLLTVVKVELEFINPIIKTELHIDSYKQPKQFLHKLLTVVLLQSSTINTDYKSKSNRTKKVL